MALVKLVLLTGTISMLMLTMRHGLLTTLLYIKTDDAATVLVKINNVEGFTYIYTVRIDRKEKTWTELDTTVYSNAGIALLSSKQAQKPTKIEPDTMGAEVMQALWGNNPTI